MVLVQLTGSIEYNAMHACLFIVISFSDPSQDACGRQTLINFHSRIYLADEET